MFGKLFLLFAILPIIEIALLVNVGEEIGGWNTVAIVIATAFLGAWLVRKEGFATLMQAQRKMQSGALPGQEMAEGLLLVIAGVLLVTPGFITDGIGFLLSLPITRPAIAGALLKRMQVHIVGGAQQQYAHYQHSHQHYAERGNPYSGSSSASSQQDGVIEGEYVDTTDDKSTLDNPHSRK
ncbi:FxsA family protein [Fluctibacter corallii]|uniref:FxsA family protein n=1 Tax=Fluctibacter corallii TaxID=2984329 RepID=UPI00384E5BD0